MNSDKQGVITAADDTYAPFLEAMAISLQEQNIPLAVFDHGLSIDTRKRLTKFKARLLETNVCYSQPMLRENLPSANVIALRAWLKPLLCQQSPFAHSLWIDADAVPLRDTEELFAHGRFITRDHFVSDQWAIRAYEQLSKILSGRFDKASCRINTGVMGFYLNDPWLKEWSDLCNQAVASKRLSKLCHCLDQSVLVAFLSKAHFKAHMPAIATSINFNYPVDGYTQYTVQHRQAYPRDGAQLLQAARDRHSTQYVVHWMGPHKKIL